MSAEELLLRQAPLLRKMFLLGQLWRVIQRGLCVFCPKKSVSSIES